MTELLSNLVGFTALAYPDAVVDPVTLRSNLWASLPVRATPLEYPAAGATAMAVAAQYRAVAEVSRGLGMADDAALYADAAALWHRVAMSGEPSAMEH